MKCPFSAKAQAIIIEGVKQSQSFGFADVLDTVGHRLTRKDITFLKPFLEWVTTNGKKFGRGNFKDVYAQFELRRERPTLVKKTDNT